MQLLLYLFLFARDGDHVLYDGLDGGQDLFVVTHGQEVVDLGVQEGVDDGEDLGKDHRGLGQVLVQDLNLALRRRVLHQGRHH